MTKDLALSIHGKNMQDSDWVTTEDFLEALAQGLLKKLS